jgi:hypothetical protein
MNNSTKRKERILPNGTPRYVRCYDNGGDTADRYTIVFTGNFPDRDRQCYYYGCSGDPSHALGIGMLDSHDKVIDRPTYSHLGKKVKFETLPEKVRKTIISYYKDFWRL